MATIIAFVRSNKKNVEVNIRFRLSDGRKCQLFYISNIKINPLHFDHKNECYKAKIIADQNIKFEINQKINATKEAIAYVYNNKEGNVDISSAWLTEKVDNYINGVKEDPKQTQDFFSLFELFISQAQIGKDRLIHYKTTLNLIRRFCDYSTIKNKSFVFEIGTISTDCWYTFLNYTQFEADLTKKIIEDKQFKNDPINNRSQNTVIAIWKRVKTFLNWSIMREYTSNVSYKMVKLSSEVYATPYYITTEERDMIYKFDLSGNKRLEIQRDIFIFHCLVGCRVGDLIELKKNNIINGAVEYIANKTLKDRANIIRVPLNNTALAIVEKYSELEGEKLFPFISAQKYNAAIKEIFKSAKLTRLVTIIDHETGREKRVPINTIASSHMARRTFVGNLYKKVKDPNLVGALSGHCEGSKAFVRYREIDEEIKKEIIKLL